MQVFIELCQELREHSRLNAANVEAELTVFLHFKKNPLKLKNELS